MTRYGANAAIHGWIRALLKISERAEVDHLCSELTAIHTRADHFATLSDELRTQLLQIQTSQRENLAS